MDAADVPQDGFTWGERRKAVYARGPSGKLELVQSRGWHAEGIATLQSNKEFEIQAQSALERVRAGKSSPLEFHMYNARMDVPMLAVATHLWHWQVRRHFRPKVFARISPALRLRYAQAFGLRPDQLDTVDAEPVYR